MLDLHVHILPGFDDGAEDGDTSLLMAQLAAKDGITHLAATPHIITGSYNHTREEILQTVESLNQTLADHDVEARCCLEENTVWNPSYRVIWPRESW